MRADVFYDFVAGGCAFFMLTRVEIDDGTPPGIDVNDGEQNQHPGVRRDKLPRVIEGFDLVDLAAVNLQLPGVDEADGAVDCIEISYVKGVIEPAGGTNQAEAEGQSMKDAQHGSEQEQQRPAGGQVGERPD